MALEKELLDRASKLQNEIVDNRRELHRNPELGMKLPNTVDFVQKKLLEMGISSSVVGGGVVANIGDPNKGKTILLRGDMDALPIKEETGLTFASENEAMHACGHDVHTSTLLGAAKLLKEIEGELKGNVKLMFQAGEEVLTGAKTMIEEGVLDDPKVDSAMMIHVFSGIEAEHGKLLIPREGAASMAPDQFHIYIKGKGGHGAMPHTTVDPLNIAAQTHLALSELVSREIKPGEKALCVIGQMSGGLAANVIPDTATISGVIRTMDPKTREFMKNRLVEYTIQCPSVINDKAMRDQAISFGKELFGEDGVLQLDPYMDDGMLSGSEDFGFISEKVPSFMVILSMGSPSKGYPFSHHHPKTDFDEDQFFKGAAYYAYFAKRWLEENN